MRSTAWHSLDAVARAVYVQIGYAYNGSNNGRIIVSVRMLADELGISKDTAAKKIHFLVERGFIAVVKQGAFSMKMRHAAEYRITAFKCDITGALASKEFMRWEPEIQNTVRPQGPNGTTTGTDGQKTTRNYPSRSLSSDRVDAGEQSHGTTTGTLLYSTMRG